MLYLYTLTSIHKLKHKEYRSFGQDGKTSLHVALWRGHTDIVNELLEAGASVHETDGVRFKCI